MTTNVPIDLTATNAAANTTPNVLVAVVVNPDGSNVGTGGGGVTPNINLASFGGDPLVLGQMDSDHSMSVVLASDQSPVIAAANITAVGGTALVLGQEPMAGSLPVVIASNQSAVPVSGTVGIAGTVPVSGNVGVSGTVGISGTVPVSGNVGVTGTVPVSAASALPVAVSGTVPVSVAATLPVSIAGTLPVSIAATVAENLTQVGGTAVTLGQKAMAASLPVVLPTDQSALPENLTQVAGAAISLGQKTMAASLPVTMASDQVGATQAFAFTAGSTQSIAVTTTSANLVLGAAATGTIQLTNAGTQVVFVALGTVAQTATVAGYPVMPGSVVVVTGGSATNLAAVTLTGAATLYVSRGMGL